MLEDSIKIDVLYVTGSGHDVKNFSCSDSISTVIKLRAGEPGFDLL
jgi:hypothetical protein